MNDSPRRLSRRDILKLGGYGLLGLLAPPRALSLLSNASISLRADGTADSASPPPLQGRVSAGVLWSYDIPSNKGKRVKMYWRDLIFNIRGAGIDDDPASYNRVWYQMEDKSYLYSGGVQPVHTRLNPAYTGPFPEDGILGEISVPYTDAHESPDLASKVKYRLYYETTHWAMSAETGADGQTWYRLLDDKFLQFYYIPAAHLRLFDDSDLAPLFPNVPSRDKRIEVRLDAQLILAYEKERAVFAARAATGAILRSGTYTTPAGTFYTFHKRPSRHMAAGDLTASGFDLPGVPWVLYLTDSGISIHGTYWHNDYGRPRSHGCINLSPTASRWLYRWTLPNVETKKQFAFDRAAGTRVDIAK